MSRVLVTGAAGQVGARLVRQLLSRNYEVRCLLLPEDPLATRLAGLDVEVMEGNLLDSELAHRAVAGVDAVVHTANLVRQPTEMSDSEFFDNNVRSTFHLVRAASRRADALTRLVHISSSSVYPNDSHMRATCYNPVDELHPLRPVGVYPLTKLITEDIVNAHVRETGLQAAMIRPSGIISGDGVLGRFTVAFVSSLLKIGQAHPEGVLYMRDGSELWRALERAASSPDQPCAITDDRGRPWIYQLVDARDVAHGCVCALESPAAVGEAFNVAAPRHIAFPEAAELLSEIAGQPVLTWQVPVHWVFDLDITKARSRIGYNPRWGIAEMLSSAVAVREGRSDGLT